MVVEAHFSAMWYVDCRLYMYWWQVIMWQRYFPRKFTITCHRINCTSTYIRSCVDSWFPRKYVFYRLKFVRIMLVLWFNVCRVYRYQVRVKRLNMNFRTFAPIIFTFKNNLAPRFLKIFCAQCFHLTYHHSMAISCWWNHIYQKCSRICQSSSNRFPVVRCLWWS